MSSEINNMEILIRLLGLAVRLVYHAIWGGRLGAAPWAKMTNSLTPCPVGGPQVLSTRFLHVSQRVINQRTMPFLNLRPLQGKCSVATIADVFLFM